MQTTQRNIVIIAVLVGTIAVAALYYSAVTEDADLKNALQTASLTLIFGLLLGGLVKLFLDSLDRGRQQRAGPANPLIGEPDMNELYRFVQLRPAELSSADNRRLVSSSSEPRTDLHQELARVVGSGGDAAEIARRWLNESQAVARLKSLDNLDMAVRAETVPLAVARFRQLVIDAFGNDQAVDQGRQLAGDFMCAVAVIPELDPFHHRERAQRFLQLASAAQYVVRGKLDAEALQMILTSSVAVLPSDLFPSRSVGMERQTPAEEEVTRSLRSADELSSSVQTGEADIRDDVTTFEQRRSTALVELTHMLQFGPEADRIVLPAMPDEEVPDDSAPRLRRAGELAVLSTRLQLSEKARDTLTDATRSFIESVALGIDDLLEVITIVERFPAPVPLAARSMAIASPTAGFPSGYGSTRQPLQGLVRPPGIGDLLVVRRSHKSYELGPIAHIENVLAGEARERTHRRLDRTEEIELREIERIEVDERDLQTTERFELVTESSNEVNSETQLQVGVQVSASYGTVKVDANFGYVSSTARTDASRQATSSARETVNRAVKRTTERIRELRQRLTVREIEETNLHKLENTSNTNRSGIYRWINHVETIGVYNYGC